jgi:hypothetical protein
VCVVSKGIGHNQYTKGEVERTQGLYKLAAILHGLIFMNLQFNNILNGNWLSFCAAKMVVNAMIADSFPASMLIHNGEAFETELCKAYGV